MVEDGPLFCNTRVRCIQKRVNDPRRLQRMLHDGNVNQKFFHQVAAPHEGTAKKDCGKRKQLEGGFQGRPPTMATMLRNDRGLKLGDGLQGSQHRLGI